MRADKKVLVQEGMKHKSKRKRNRAWGFLVIKRI